MPALLDLRRRIRSIRNTQQVTQAMKTVATARFKKFQRLVMEGRPFWHQEPPVLARLIGWALAVESVYTERRPEKRILVTVVTSDKGLCGAFNSNLLARAESFLVEKTRQGVKVELLLLGKKAAQFFKRHSFPVFQTIGEKVDRLPAQEIAKLAREIINLYLVYRIDSFYIIYNEFRSILAPQITILKLLPLAPAAAGEMGELEPDWEPGAQWLGERLIPLYLERQLNHVILESQAAEQAARMMAMENATRNAEDLISNLILVMNKIRQAAITKELLEIMTAVEALQKS